MGTKVVVIREKTRADHYPKSPPPKPYYTPPQKRIGPCQCASCQARRSNEDFWGIVIGIVVFFVFCLCVGGCFAAMNRSSEPVYYYYR